MAIQIKIRRDTKAEWDSADPVLLAGELGFELKDSATSGRFKIGNGSREWSRLPFWYAYQDSAGAYGSASGGSGTHYGSRMIVYGGNSNGPTDYTPLINNIVYFTVTPGVNTLINDFGDLTTSPRAESTGASDGTYGVMAVANSTTDNTVNYITIATTGNASDFGNRTATGWGGAGVSDGTYAYFMGGSNNALNVIDYATIQTPSDCTDFGDLTVGRSNGGATGDMSRLMKMGGWSTSATNVIDYITAGSAANATDFGDLTAAKAGGCCTDDTYAVSFGSTLVSGSNVIDYVTIQTTSNATDFGDMVNATFQCAAGSDGTYGVSYGNGGDFDYPKQYITIATPGNATYEIGYQNNADGYLPHGQWLNAGLTGSPS